MTTPEDLEIQLQLPAAPGLELVAAETAAAIVDYGNAIKDLATSNIFPGDLLLKNFGVTRHGRVVFYDYDELMLMTDCNFRKMPAARSDEEELSADRASMLVERVLAANDADRRTALANVDDAAHSEVSAGRSNLEHY